MDFVERRSYMFFTQTETPAIHFIYNKKPGGYECRQGVSTASGHSPGRLLGTSMEDAYMSSRWKKKTLDMTLCHIFKTKC